jgi:hypothetical protein
MILTAGLGVGGGLAARGYGAWSTSVATTATQGIGRAGIAGPEPIRMAPFAPARPSDNEATRRIAAVRERVESAAPERTPVVAATRHTVTASARPAGSRSARRNTQRSTR